MAKFGDKVKAYPPQLDGPLVGFFVKEAGDKDVIQVGDDTYSLAYREPADYDDAGSTGTYCNV